MHSNTEADLRKDYTDFIIDDKIRKAEIALLTMRGSKEYKDAKSKWKNELRAKYGKPEKDALEAQTKTGIQHAVHTSATLLQKVIKSFKDSLKTEEKEIQS